MFGQSSEDALTAVHGSCELSEEMRDSRLGAAGERFGSQLQDDRITELMATNLTCLSNGGILEAFGRRLP